MLKRLSQKEIKELVSSVKGLPEEIRDEMAIPSYLHYNPFIRWLMWKRYTGVADWLKLTPEQVILEFGCGLGVFLPTISQGGGTVYAIDIFPQYAKKLVEDLQLPVVFFDSIAEVGEESLDIIIAVDVLEHVDEPGWFVSLFKNKLKKSGQLVICGPTETFIYKSGRVLAGFGKKGEYHHSDIDKLKTVIEDASFRLLKTRTLPFRFPPYLFKIFLFEKSK